MLIRRVLRMFFSLLLKLFMKKGSLKQQQWQQFQMCCFVILISLLQFFWMHCAVCCPSVHPLFLTPFPIRVALLEGVEDKMFLVLPVFEKPSLLPMSNCFSHDFCFQYHMSYADKERYENEERPEVQRQILAEIARKLPVYTRTGSGGQQSRELCCSESNQAD